jgi:diadenosine tetraphosphate (Ap4A) HIT family hydrolase
MTFPELRDFLSKKMRMSEIYQPAVIRMLLKNNGEASLQEIAEFIAPLDEEIVNYYIDKLKDQPKKVLKNHGIAEIKPRSKFFSSIGCLNFSEAERIELIKLCDFKIREWLAKNSSVEAEYRGLGRMRHHLLADHRYCAMCGLTPEDKVKLDIDHIIPRSMGGGNELSNLQVLCHRCNRGKGNSLIISAAEARKKVRDVHHDCVFCTLPDERVVFNTSKFKIIKDAYPVTEGHTLIIPHRHVESPMALTVDEFKEIHGAIAIAKAHLHSSHENIKGFNLGFNDGETAGQTVMHAHFHVIPRRKGDVAEPRGGIRGVIPGKQKY